MAKKSRTRFAILCMLRMEPMSGYDIKKACEASLGQFWNESIGQIYPELARLLEEGCVRIHAREGEGKRIKQLYAMTEDGHRVLREWLAVPPLARSVRDELLLKLSCGAEVGPKTHIGHIERLRFETRDALTALKVAEGGIRGRLAGSPDLAYLLLPVRQEVLLSEARLQWCEEALGSLASVEGQAAKEAS